MYNQILVPHDGTRLSEAALVHALKLAKVEMRGIDLIVMASHERRGLESLLIGSETQKVLTHCRTPVLVVRS